MRKARKFSPEFKAQVVLEIVSGNISLAEASRQHQIKKTVLSRWTAQFLNGATGIFEAGRPAEEKRLRERIADLERLAGEQALQLEIAEKAKRYLKSMPPASES